MHHKENLHIDNVLTQEQKGSPGMSGATYYRLKQTQTGQQTMCASIHYKKAFDSVLHLSLVYVFQTGRNDVYRIVLFGSKYSYLDKCDCQLPKMALQEEEQDKLPISFVFSEYRIKTSTLIFEQCFLTFLWCELY